jgi:hypothetical protein
MKQFKRYPSIEQFRSVVKQVKEQVSYVGKDEDGKPIYDFTKPLPTITFKGTVKLHGTNAAIGYSKQEGLWCQSRERILSVEKDNAGFAFWVESNRLYFENTLSTIDTAFNYDTVIVYGEWGGSGIQKGVGISELSKAFYPFTVEYLEDGVVVYTVILPCGDDKCNWLHYQQIGMYPITKFKTYSVDIDFKCPELMQNKLGEITQEVENECPVAKEFGVTGIGEGVVWTAEWNNQVLRFKVKGEKHSSSKVKTLASVDVEKVSGAVEFATNVVTDSRFNQAIENVFNGIPFDIKQLGDVIKWVMNDVLKEEIDTMSANGLEPKDVGKYISQNVKDKFFAMGI